MLRIILFVSALLIPAGVSAGSKDVLKLLQDLQILTDPNLTDGEKAGAVLGVIIDEPQPSSGGVGVGLRPLGRPFLTVSKRLRPQLRRREFNRAVIAMCGNGVQGISSCEDAHWRLQRLTSGCADVHIWFAPVSAETPVHNNWSRWDRNPNLMLFTRDLTGSLVEHGVPRPPSAYEVEEALGCF